MQTVTIYKLPEGAGVPDSLDSLEHSDVIFDEPVYTLSTGSQGDFDSPVLRLVYSSLTTPHTTIDQHMDTGNRSGYAS